jgi:hypothetical protein
VKVPQWDVDRIILQNGFAGSSEMSWGEESIPRCRWAMPWPSSEQQRRRQEVCRAFILCNGDGDDIKDEEGTLFQRRGITTEMITRTTTMARLEP